MKTEAIRFCIQAQHGKEDYAEARKELNALLERIAQLGAAQQSVHPTDGILRAQQQLSPTKSGTAHDPNLGKPISG